MLFLSLYIRDSCSELPIFCQKVQCMVRKEEKRARKKWAYSGMANCLFPKTKGHEAARTLACITLGADLRGRLLDDSKRLR